MAMYIKGMGNISPQQSWNDEGALLQAFDYRGNKLVCLEPDYDQWIDPRLSRRMSRIIKMGVTAALMALKEANISMPDAIITGTGYGCLADTASFLTRLIDNNEQALNPTPFIQSTHNTIGSQLALLIQCQAYNQTYAQGAFSFENALTDAELQLTENADQHIVIGGIDEIIAESHLIQERFGIFRKKLASTLNLFNTPKKGTVNGEGAAFFVLHGKQDDASLVCIDGFRTMYKPDAAQLKKGLRIFIHECGLLPSQIDLVLLGKSGDKKSDLTMDNLCLEFFPNSGIGLYKHLCGEFPTASAFALWLAARIIIERHVPEVVVYKHVGRPLRNVLILNSVLGTHHSFMLLKPCHDII